MDQIAPDIAGEGIVAELRGKGVAPIEVHAGGGDEETRDAASALDDAFHHTGDPPAGPDNPPRFVRADAMHGGGRAIGRDVEERGG